MNLSKDEIVELLSNDNQEILFKKADEIRQQYVGDEVHLRGLMEFSNICRNNCMYCGIRRDNNELKRYRMSKEEIIETAKNAANIGFKTIVMQSGEDLHFSNDVMCEILSEIKKFDVAITLSVGERTYEDYKLWKEAGADRYLIRIETTDKDLYHRLDPGMSWQNRYNCSMWLKELGYELGSGIMVGLPGQSIESIADDLLFLRDIEVDMAGIGPFIPAPNTPLANEKGGTLNLALRTMAVMRLLMPDINIPATTAMESLHPNGRIMALQAGANVVMPNITANEYKQLYTLYPNKTNVDKAQSNTDIVAKITSIGRTIGKGYGEHKKKI
ncbi:MAG: [FeFe] hydrogenase H-cluster radical SAM maturase HydE [Alphaproteobacteria bacterium]|nr:[FeFe] hydrogenase H-cluster radical SAM maturase HydE [Alphaproteobacteria bacterium]